MIVVDENLHDRRLMEAISAWYPVKVVSVVALRPASIIKDDAIPSLLIKVEQPTFVTINDADFWGRIQPHTAYCVVIVDIPMERIRDIPDLLRRLLNRTEFKTKASRMGKVIRLKQASLEYYGADLAIHSLPWNIHGGQSSGLNLK